MRDAITARVDFAALRDMDGVADRIINAIVPTAPLSAKRGNMFGPRTPQNPI